MAADRQTPKSGRVPAADPGGLEDRQLLARRRGLQLGTSDALLIQLCRRNDLTLLTTHQDVHAATKHVEFRLWSAG